LLAGFALFRLFDVWKPWPIRWFDQRVKGGMGVMIDDVIAGIFAAIVLRVLLHLIG
jgi:phosphatidylglycerophosphatase A